MRKTYILRRLLTMPQLSPPVKKGQKNRPEKEAWMELRQQYLGALGLLGEISVHISNHTGDAEEHRALIAEALEAATILIPGLKVRRILNRFEIETRAPVVSAVPHAVVLEDACRAALDNLDAASRGGRPPVNDLALAKQLRIAIWGTDKP